jgi:hypothetical protein
MQCVSAQLIQTCLEGDSGPQALLLENQGHGPAGQWLPGMSVVCAEFSLEVGRASEYELVIVTRQVGGAEEVACQKRAGSDRREGLPHCLLPKSVIAGGLAARRSWLRMSRSL